MFQRIEEDYKTAFKNKDEVAKSSLGNLKSALKNVQIEKGSDLTDDEVKAVIAKKVKQHKDSITEFEKGGRADLVENEQKQMEVLAAYLPKQMDEGRVRELVVATIKDLSATTKDFGKVMKEVLSRAAGQTDGTVVSKIVKEELK